MSHVDVLQRTVNNWEIQEQRKMNESQLRHQVENSSNKRVQEELNGNSSPG